MIDRRIDTRTPVDFLVNKYIDGQAYLARAIDLSWRGVLLSGSIEPDKHPAIYAVELGLPDADQPIWVWAEPVWTAGRKQALRFVGIDERDGNLLARYLDRATH